MSEITKFRVQSGIESRSFTGAGGEQVPVKEFVATLPGGDDVLVSVMGRDAEKVPASWEVSTIVEVKDGMTLESSGPVKGGDHKGKPGYRLKWPRAGGGRSGGYSGRPAPTDMQGDEYLGHWIMAFKEVLDAIVEKDPRAYLEALPVAGAAATSYMISANVHVVFSGPKMPAAKPDSVPF